MKRRRSSMLKLVQTMQAFDKIENYDDDDDDDDDDENKSCDSFYQQIDEIEEEALDPLSFIMSTASFSESIQLSNLNIKHVPLPQMSFDERCLEHEKSRP